jgi:glycosyltransferase involved in cell wall biosynthesis
MTQSRGVAVNGAPAASGEEAWRKSPLFSVVIPTYNRSELLGLAIQSVLRQTCPDFEVVVCDNCSEDDTGAVVARVGDSRVRYVRTAGHLVIADNWEFARSQATGTLVLMLSDDDALVPAALETFAAEYERNGADFLFCARAEYRDRSYPGWGRNTVICRAFTGESRVVPAREFLESLFSFRFKFDMHPSAFIFEKALADRIAARGGRFFQTNGVEYCAWPLAAVTARKIIYVDRPLVICGRTGKSWGSNMQLANPGKERIAEFIADVDPMRRSAPLTNFAMSNLMAEGLMTAKKMLPEELAGYEFDERAYLRLTMWDLGTRHLQGVDVAKEMDEAIRYARKYPALQEALLQERAAYEPAVTLALRIRWAIGRLGARRLRNLRRSFQRMLRMRKEVRKVRAGDVQSGFEVPGEQFGFRDILGCAEFLEEVGAHGRSTNGAGAVESRT